MDYSAVSQLSPSNTVAFMVVVNLLLFGALLNAVWCALRHKRRAHDAAASVSSGEPRVAPGARPRRVVLRGTVHTDDPGRPAVVVTIRERGEEVQAKGSWSHVWTEFDREVQVEPFDLVLTSGTRVRVEPDPDVFLVDKLEIAQRGNPRTRVARLEHGEIAYVDGVLGVGRRRVVASAADADATGLYRDASATSLVLTNGVERMLVSTEPLALRHRRRSRAHSTMAAMLGVALLIVNTVIFGSTIMIDTLGDVVEARVITTRTWVTTNKGSSTTHYGVRASYVDPATGGDVEVSDEIGYGAYSAAQRGTSLPFRVVLGSPSFACVGTGATVGPVRFIPTVLLVVFLLVAYVVRVRSARDWFDRDIVVERGAGRLQL